MPAVPRDVIVSASDRLTDDRAASEGSSTSRKSGKADFGFGRQHRLLAAAQYAAVFASRRTVRSARFILHYLLRSQDEDARARLGLVIPKKQARSAVLRNAVKRQAREVFRHRCHELPAIDVVLRLAQPVASCSKPERAAWHDEISRLFDQASQKIRT